MKYIVRVTAICGYLAISPYALAGAPPAGTPAALQVTNVLSLLAQTSAVVEGTVTGIVSEYTDKTGPWTRIEFADVAVHRGSVGEANPTTLAIRQRGGEFPDGRRLIVSHVPEFIKGERYVLLLRNTAWYLSPIVGEVALRITSIDGTEALINDGGSGLLGFSSDGLSFSEPIISLPDRNGALPSGLVDQPQPKGLVSLKTFIQEIDDQLKARGISLTGPFFDEPVQRSADDAVEPAKSDTSTPIEQPAPVVLP